MCLACPSPFVPVLLCFPSCALPFRAAPGGGPGTPLVPCLQMAGQRQGCPPADFVHSVSCPLGSPSSVCIKPPTYCNSRLCQLCSKWTQGSGEWRRMPAGRRMPTGLCCHKGDDSLSSPPPPALLSFPWTESHYFWQAFEPLCWPRQTSARAPWQVPLQLAGDPCSRLLILTHVLKPWSLVVLAHGASTPTPGKRRRL